jgi:hypothetical protein
MSSGANACSEAVQSRYWLGRELPAQASRNKTEEISCLGLQLNLAGCADRSALGQFGLGGALLAQGFVECFCA